MNPHVAKSLDDIKTPYSRETAIETFEMYSKITDTVAVGLQILKKNQHGDAAVVAKVYRHPCGEVAVYSDCPVTLRTMQSMILPVMKDFDEVLIAIDARERDGKGILVIETFPTR
jgi:hypothetical protein